MCQCDSSDFNNSLLLKKGNIENETDCHFKKTFYKINSLRQHGLFCDVILVTRNVEIHAHKVVLASSSDFFDNSFLKMGEEKRLSIEQIDDKALSVLVNYIYTSCIEVEISVTSVQDLLIGANILQLKNIKEDCCKYLENNINLNTALNILLIAQDQKYVSLLKKAEDFVDKNIIEIMNTQQLLNLSVDQLTQLITRDTLEVPSEEKIYEGVISWVKHDSNFVKKEELLKTDMQCKDLIIHALLSKRISEMIKPKARKGSQPYEILLVIGGYDRKTFEMYDFKTNNWSKIYSMPTGKSAYNLAFINRKLYVVTCNNITEYDLTNNCWHNLVEMSLPRRYCRIGVLNDSIYVVGGCCNEKETNSVEKFNITSQKLSSIAPMYTARYWAGVGVLDGFLYVVGGSSNRTILNSVEVYDPNLNIWKRCSNLITARSSAAVGILHNKMYVIGGYDGTKIISSVEYYSPAMNRFTQSASLNIPRYDSAVVVFDDKLYVIGGHGGNQDLDNVEVYCPKNDKWEVLPSTMNVTRYNHGVAIINKFIDF